MTDAKVLLLDEPNNGLDKDTLVAFKEILLEQSQMKLILLSCHDQNFRESLNVKNTFLDELKAK